MSKFKTNLTSFLKYFLTVGIFSIPVFWPIFNLHLTGDDYLGLWRYNYFVKYQNGGGNWNNLNFFLTDYGPQDLFTKTIHDFVGFQPVYYYLVNYLFRLIAAVTVFPLVRFLTKSKKIALWSMLFFSICTTGLETTDWSFNAPSYLAIASFNMFIYFYLQFKTTLKWKYLFISLLLVPLTIVLQPIRMVFLPGLVILMEIFFLFINKFKHLRLSVVSFILLVFISTTPILLGKLGESFGFRNSSSQFMQEYTTGIINTINTKNYRLLLNPFLQVGSVAFPNTLIPKRLSTLSENRLTYVIAFPLLVSFAAIGLVIKKNIGLSNKNYLFQILMATAWSFLIWILYIHKNPYLPSTAQIVTALSAGYFFIILISLYFIKKDSKLINFGLFIGAATIIIPCLIPWLRDQNMLSTTIQRYLIVPSIGLTLIFASIASLGKKYLHIWVALFVGIIAINMLASFRYLHHLSTVRPLVLTERIRNSIPYNPDLGKTEEPIVYYFESNNPELLYHTLMFGFPVIMSFEQNFSNPWGFAYTENWQEVVSAHIDGSGLIRFGTVPIKPVKLENIYSFKLDYGKLIDTTQTTREKLMEIDKQLNQISKASS